MTYALILLAIVAIFTTSAWNGISSPSVNKTSIRASIVSSYENIRYKATSTVKNTIREKLRNVVDDAFEE